MTKRVKKLSRMEELSTRLTNWVGTPTSIVVHTIMFVAIFALNLLGISFENILLILTTLVSLEAIYLAIFIQMTVNRNTQALAEVEEDIEEIQEDVEDIQEDVVEIDKDFDTLQSNVLEIGDDVEDISQEVEDISEDMDTIAPPSDAQSLQKISEQLASIMKDLNELKNKTN